MLHDVEVPRTTQCCLYYTLHHTVFFAEQGALCIIHAHFIAGTGRHSIATYNPASVLPVPVYWRCASTFAGQVLGRLTTININSREYDTKSQNIGQIMSDTS